MVELQMRNQRMSKTIETMPRQQAPPRHLQEALRGEELCVVVTDSGLGGLSVAADLVELLKRRRCFRQARVVFFNCLPSVKVGFDAMRSDKRRYRVFSNALDCMTERFNPDAILLACNSISCIYDGTDFARRATVPVLDIIELGTNLVAAELENHATAHAILFAAKTTAHTAVHKRRLVAAGFAAERLSYHVCQPLIGAVENDAASPATRSIVQRCVDDALQAVGNRSAPVIASLNCTHFNFASEQFKRAFRNHPGRLAGLVDPTGLMATDFLQTTPENHFDATEVSAKVVTQTPHGPEKKASLGALLHSRSPQMAAALQNDIFVPEMFDFA